MKTTQRILAITSTALLLGIALPAYAIDVNVGGVGVSATTGGGSVATVGVTSDAGGNSGTDAELVISNTDGSLVDLQNEENSTTGTVNLGGAGGLGDLGGIDLGDLDLGDIGGIDGVLPGGDGAGGGTDAEAQVVASFNALTGSEQTVLRARCRAVMMNPDAFEPSLVALCRIIATVNN